MDLWHDTRVHLTNSIFLAIHISMKFLFYSYLNFNEMIATKFYTWHKSSIAMACAKYCCNLMIRNWITARWISNQIWIVWKLFMKSTLGTHYTLVYEIIIEILWKSFLLLLIVSDNLIRVQICTCHDSCAVMTCAKLWPDQIILFHIRAKRISTRFQLWVHKPFVKQSRTDIRVKGEKNIWN